MGNAGHCAYGGGCLCDWCYADMQSKKKKKLSMKSTVVIGIAAFIIAIVAVIEIARIPMPL